MSQLKHSHGLRDGEVQLLKSHNQLTLCVKASSELEFSLFECSVAKKKVEMKILLFSLWDRLQSSEEKLTSNHRSLSLSLIMCTAVFV